jgi:hypothetical protein
VAREDDVWAAPPETSGAQAYMGYPPYLASPAWSRHVDETARRATRKAWLERRFPDRREAQVLGVRLRPVASALLLVGLVGLGAWVLVQGSPESNTTTPRWGTVLLITLGAVLVVGCLSLAVMTRRPPRVWSDDVWFLTRLSRAERRSLIADMRAAEPPDADQLDVVAAAWLKERQQLLLLWPVQMLGAVLMILRWAPGLWTVLPVVALVLTTHEVAEGVPRLLAARAWLRRRAHDGRTDG